MRIRQLVLSSLAVAAVTPLIGITAAYGAFPGTNGRLVYQRETVAGDHTQTDLVTINPNGSGSRVLTNTPNQNEFGPAWNKAGTKLTFWRTPAPFGTGSVWTMNADGTSPHRLTTGIDARDPVWNPAGTRIAFTLVDATGFHLWSMRASDGGDRQRLTSGANLDFEPAWSPDGKSIAFTRGSQQGDAGDVYVLTLGTGAIRRVSNSPDYDHQVAWSPNGARLVFERDLASSSSIYAVDADGTHLTRLTGAGFFDVGPAYSPDGTMIAFGTDRSGGFQGDLWLMRADGTNQHVLRTLPFVESFPDWQPLH